MRNDGKFIIYVLEAKATSADGFGNKPDWFGASLDHFGTPSGFSAADGCWQKTGIHGTFDEEQGIAAVKVMSREHVEFHWRLMRMEISQHHFEVASFAAKKPGQKEPKSYPSDNEYRRRIQAIKKG